jgi:hypothetical protein
VGTSTAVVLVVLTSCVHWQFNCESHTQLRVYAAVLLLVASS